MRVALNREKAVIVLQEIMKACSGAVDINHISLEPSKAQGHGNSDDYELHIGLPDYDAVRKCIDPVLEKHKLSVKQCEDIMVLACRVDVS